MKLFTKMDTRNVNVDLINYVKNYNQLRFSCPTYCNKELSEFKEAITNASQTYAAFDCYIEGTMCGMNSYTKDAYSYYEKEYKDSLNAVEQKFLSFKSCIKENNKK